MANLNLLHIAHSPIGLFARLINKILGLSVTWCDYDFSTACLSGWVENSPWSLHFWKIALYSFFTYKSSRNIQTFISLNKFAMLINICTHKISKLNLQNWIWIFSFVMQIVCEKCVFTKYLTAWREFVVLYSIYLPTHH